LIEREVRQRLRERFDTTLARFDLMSQLDRAPKGLTMGELSSRLMVTNGNVTGLTDAFLREGLVSRAPEPADRRSLRIKLTAAGKRFFDGMTPVHEQWIDDLMTGLTRAEMAHLLELLGKLKQSLGPAGARK
jgi:DNA-binding MarR family transcriptional regulator